MSTRPDPPQREPEPSTRTLRETVATGTWLHLAALRSRVRWLHGMTGAPFLRIPARSTRRPPLSTFVAIGWPPMKKVRAEYIWIDGQKPTAKLRSKTKIVEGPIAKVE